jgi:membrane protease subunit HflK
MEKVLSGANKIVLDKSATGSGVLPYLPLPELRGSKATPSANQTPQTPTGSSQTQQR